MAVSDVTLGTAVNQQNKTANSTQQLAGDFSQFLSLLTTQLQNQDPLDPMDTNQFTQQLVEFSQVEQQINTNQKLDNLVALNLGNALGSAIGYVGMDVSYLSSEFNYDGTKPMNIDYALDAQAVSSKLQILDETGHVVYQTDVQKTPGKNTFTWDGSLTNGGKAGPGTYQVKIAALDSDDQTVNTSTVVSGRVRGIETQDGIINLLIGDRAVPLSTVLNAVKPADTATGSST